MSNNNNAPKTIGQAGMRLPVIPFKRVFKDKNRYDRKQKHRKEWA